MRKSSRLSVLLLVLSLSLSLVMSACAPRAGGAPAANSDLIVDLPPLVVEYDADGKVSLFGMAGAALGVDLAALEMSAETVATMQASNVQHLTIINKPSSIRIFINNQPGLALLMDADARSALKNILPLLGEGTESLGGVFELLPKLGVGVVLKFPAAAGKQAIAIKPPASLPSVADDEAALKKARSTQPAVALTLDYNAQGIPTIGGINPMMLGMMGLSADMMKLPASALDSVGGMGIQSVALTTLPGSLLLALNGGSLPLISWGDANGLNNFMLLINVLAKSQGVDPAPLQQLPTILNLPMVLNAQMSFPK